jgi:hypothetical protein
MSQGVSVPRELCSLKKFCLREFGRDSKRNWERPARDRHFRAGNMTARARTFSQAPQAVRSARGRRWDRAFPSAARAGRTFHPNKCNAFGLTADVHRLGNIPGTAAARAILRSHLSPSVAIEFFTKSGSLRQKVICVTKHEQCCL